MVLIQNKHTSDFIQKTGNHSWNMINLEGDWYHVDVTWEGPISYNHYGFYELWNRYINLTDTDVRNLENHSYWEGAGDAIASATK